MKADTDADIGFSSGPGDIFAVMHQSRTDTLPACIRHNADILYFRHVQPPEKRIDRLPDQLGIARFIRQKYFALSGRLFGKTAFEISRFVMVAHLEGNLLQNADIF
jgi:hypothetical protein